MLGGDFSIANKNLSGLVASARSASRESDEGEKDDGVMHSFKMRFWTWSNHNERLLEIWASSSLDTWKTLEL
jgi:hypothetical protein